MLIAIQEIESKPSDLPELALYMPKLCQPCSNAKPSDLPAGQCRHQNCL